jgi:hypothetical protein
LEDEESQVYPAKADQRNENFRSALNFFGSSSFQARPKSQNAFSRGRPGFSAYGETAEKRVQRANATGSIERYSAFGNYINFYHEQPDKTSEGETS